MGFCYPGKAASGDNPPRPECAPRWHEELDAYAAEHIDTATQQGVGQQADRRADHDRARGRGRHSARRCSSVSFTSVVPVISTTSAEGSTSSA
jgi:hypothetical protein